jgi:mono/diheme cytochrome c family protein
MRPTVGIATILLLGVAACGGDEAEVEIEGEAPAPATAPAPSPATDSGAARGAEGATTAALPQGVDQAMVQAGSAMFATSVCTACHGPQGGGVQGVGPNLTDQTWLNVDGSYESIVQVITNGVMEPKESATPMPPKGGNVALTDEQVRQLAAYVYARSHGP